MVKRVSKRGDGGTPTGTFNYEALAHYWRYNHGTKGSSKISALSEAYSRSGYRMYAKGDVIYSYDLPIAKVYDNKLKGESPFVLLQNDSSSNTTNKHIWAVKNSLGAVVFCTVDNVVPNSKQNHEDNLDSYLRVLENIRDNYHRKRVTSTRRVAQSEWGRAMRMATAYATQFKVKSCTTYKAIMKVSSPFNKTKEELLADKIALEKSEERAKKRQQSKLRKEKAIKFGEYKESLKDWLELKTDYIKHNNTFRFNETHIRINGAVIETTRSANISLKSCIRAFKLYREGKLEVGDKISGFDFRGVHDGIAEIGCHSIEIKKIEELLGRLQ